MNIELWSLEELMIFWTHHGTIIDFWKNIDPWLNIELEILITFKIHICEIHANGRFPCIILLKIFQFTTGTNHPNRQYIPLVGWFTL